MAEVQHNRCMQQLILLNSGFLWMNFPLWMSLGSWNAINSLKSTPPLNDLPDDDTFCIHTSTRYIVHNKLLSEWDFTSTALSLPWQWCPLGLWTRQKLLIVYNLSIISLTKWFSMEFTHGALRHRAFQACLQCFYGFYEWFG